MIIFRRQAIFDTDILKAGTPIKVKTTLSESAYIAIIIYVDKTRLVVDLYKPTNDGWNRGKETDIRANDLKANGGKYEIMPYISDTRGEVTWS